MADADITTPEPAAQEEPRKKRFRPTSGCTYPGCEEWAWARGYCGTHYQKLRNSGELQAVRIVNDPLKRFHVSYKVNEATGCWEWTATMRTTGYGVLNIGARSRKVRAHRFSYETFVGPIPDGMMVCHSCDVARCVRPSHLFLGTGSDNVRDCVSKGRHAAQRGASQPKFTAAMVTNIRVMYARGEHSMFDLAAIYGVKQTTISDIVKGRAHLKIGRLAGLSS